MMTMSVCITLLFSKYFTGQLEGRKAYTLEKRQSKGNTKASFPLSAVKSWLNCFNYYYSIIAFSVLQIADQLFTKLVQRNVATEITLLRNPTEVTEVLVS